MTRNVGPADRIVRIAVGVGLAVVVFFDVLFNTETIVVGVLAAYLLLTGLFGWCLFYKLAGIDTTVQKEHYSTTDERAGL